MISKRMALGKLRIYTMNRKQKIATAMIMLFVLCAAQPVTASRQSTGPFGLEEILSLLKGGDGGRLSQGDIAGEIDRRGISFVADEKALDNLRRAGAKRVVLDAIARATKGATVPQLERSDAAPPEQAGDEADEARRAEALAQLPLLEQARHHAMEFAEEIPNFVVTQVVSRYSQAPGSKDWALEDTLEVELTYRVGKGEQFKVLRVNGSPTNRSYNELGGSTSTGEFGTILTSVFAPYSKAEFKEAGRELFNKRQATIYDFKVRRANSHSKISDRSSGQSVVTGYSGSIWIDSETKRVLRIELSHAEMPAGFPVTMAENAVEYDWVSIGQDRYLLPVRAEVLLGRDRDRSYTRNVIEFKNYKRFEATIKLSDN